MISLWTECKGVKRSSTVGNDACCDSSDINNFEINTQNFSEDPCTNKQQNFAKRSSSCEVEAKRHCKEKLRVSEDDDSSDVSNSEKYASRGYISKTYNSATNGPLGGLFTSRLTPSTAGMVWSSPNRIRLTDTRDRVYPGFDGCPDWVKPMMHIEYEVKSVHRILECRSLL